MITAKIVKLLEENTVILCDTGLNNGILEMTSKAQTTKEKTR